MKQNHPIWRTVHATALIAAVGVVLYVNASNFDSTEIKSIAEIAAVIAGAQGLSWWNRRDKDRN